MCKENEFGIITPQYTDARAERVTKLLLSKLKDLPTFSPSNKHSCKTTTRDIHVRFIATKPYIYQPQRAHMKTLPMHVNLLGAPQKQQSMLH